MVIPLLLLLDIKFYSLYLCLYLFILSFLKSTLFI